jgi:hypothetical protein
MRVGRVGNGSEVRLFQDEKEIGRVDATAVSFLGFVARDDAALAASVAYRALARRWQDAEARQESLATLLPPAPEEAATGGWGFEIHFFPVSGSRSSLLRERASSGGHSRVVEFPGACGSSRTGWPRLNHQCPSAPPRPGRCLDLPGPAALEDPGAGLAGGVSPCGGPLACTHAHLPLLVAGRHPRWRLCSTRSNRTLLYCDRAYRPAPAAPSADPSGTRGHAAYSAGSASGFGTAQLR